MNSLVDNPIDELSDFNDTMRESVLEIPPSMMRIYFIFLFILVVAVVIALLMKLTNIEDIDIPLSMRGELLSHLVLFCQVYAFSWLPILFLGILDGELETSSVSNGIKGQIANIHCALQDLMVRSFCMIIVVSSALAYHYSDVKISESCCSGRPSMFIWGILIPVAITETTRFLMDRNEWLMPTQSIIHHLGPIPFSIKSSMENIFTPVFCIQRIDQDWLRHVAVEWLETVMLVVATIFCCLPCFRYYKEESDSKDPKSKSDSQQSLDSPELQMESLIQIDSEPLQTSQDKQSSATDTPDNTGSEKKKSDHNNKLACKTLYAKGGGFLEAIVIIGNLWSAAVRPFMAIAMYALNDGTYSNYLDIPTHVLLIIATAILPLELCTKWDDGDKKDSENDQDVVPIWKTEDERKKGELDDRDGDVDPLWSREEPAMENVKEKDSVANNSPNRETTSR